MNAPSSTPSIAVCRNGSRALDTPTLCTFSEISLGEYASRPSCKYAIGAPGAKLSRYPGHFRGPRQAPLDAGQTAAARRDQGAFLRAGRNPRRRALGTTEAKAPA